MKNLAIAVAVAAVAGMFVFSAVAINIPGNQNFTGEVNIDGDLMLKGTKVTATAAELNIMDTVTATAAEINRAADLSAGQRAVTVTNGQAVALTAADAVIALTSTGVASGETNTITIAQPYPAGNRVLLRVASASTNLVKIADSTTVMALGADVNMAATATLDLYFAATNEAVKISTSAN